MTAKINEPQYSYSIKSPADIKYELIYKNKRLDYGLMLIHLGIKNGDLIELKSSVMLILSEYYNQ